MGLGYGRRNKYGARRVEYDGIKFDSKLECEQYKVLKLLESKGKITDLECQPKVYLTKSRILYKPDFKFFDVDAAKWVWVDVKGMQTAVFRIKLRLWRVYGPGELQIWERTSRAKGAGISVTSITHGAGET